MKFMSNHTWRSRELKQNSKQLMSNHTTARNNGLCRFHSWWSSPAQVTNKFLRLPPLPEIQELSGLSGDQDKP